MLGSVVHQELSGLLLVRIQALSLLEEPGEDITEDFVLVYM